MKNLLKVSICVLVVIFLVGGSVSVTFAGGTVLIEPTAVGNSWGDGIKVSGNVKGIYDGFSNDCYQGDFEAITAIYMSDRAGYKEAVALILTAYLSGKTLQLTVGNGCYQGNIAKIKDVDVFD